MYELRRISDPGELVALATAPAPRGPGVSHEQAQRATLLVVQASQVIDPGPDFTRWILTDANNEQIASVDVPGY